MNANQAKNNNYYSDLPTMTITLPVPEGTARAILQLIQDGLGPYVIRLENTSIYGATLVIARTFLDTGTEVWGTDAHIQKEQERRINLMKDYYNNSAHLFKPDEKSALIEVQRQAAHLSAPEQSNYADFIRKDDVEDEFEYSPEEVERVFG